MNSADNIFIIGRMLTLNTTFLTIKLFSIIEYVALDRLSEKKNHGIMPAIIHSIKGKLSTGVDLKPT
jgi:hypothetical protein